MYRINKDKATKTVFNKVIHSWVGSFYIAKISILFILIYKLTEFQLTVYLELDDSKFHLEE